MKRRLLFGAVGVALLALVLWGLWPRALEVEVARVVRGPFRQTIEEEGKTRVRERYTVSTPVAGTLARIELHAGDAVEPGTVLARLLPLPSPMLDPRYRKVAEDKLASAKDAHREALASTARAEAAASLAASNLLRTRDLVSKQALPPLQLEQAEAENRIRESELESLRFAEKVAAHGVEEAQAAMGSFNNNQSGAHEQFELTSPIRGRVLHVLRESAGVVPTGEALLELGDPASLEVVVQLLSQDVVPVRPGMAATLSHWGGEGQLQAHVRRVEPAAFTHLSALGVEEQRVNVLLDFDDKAVGTSLLGDGFALEATILLWSGEAVAQIPTSALFRQDNGWAVFVLEGGRAVIRKVAVGHRGPLQTEVLEGLAVGDLVVAHPAPTLKPGARAKPLQARHFTQGGRSWA